MSGGPMQVRWRNEASRERAFLIALLAVSALACVLVITQRDWASINLLLIPLVVGSLVLSPRRLSWFVIAVMALALIGVSQRPDPTAVTVTSTACVFVIGFIVLLTAFRRARLGVAGALGESMFVDLRDRLLRQATVPDLPEGWVVETALDSAGGTLFAGDFIVTSRREDLVEVAVVDVSGKGEAAGTRALLLCGAFGGLLGSVPPADFLPAANSYLVRQAWDEGFATAVHLSIDLATGHFEVRTAGHPPALLRRGAGWDRLTSYGVFLGLLPEAAFHEATGTLAEGETLLLYTDGLIEEPTHDIDVGIDLLADHAWAEMRRDLVGAADRLVAEVGAHDDDRTLVLVHRF